MSEEQVKGAFHMAAALIVSPLLAYNAKEYLTRKDARNLFNTAVYCAAIGFEVYNTYGHWRHGCAQERNGDTR